MDSFSQVKLEKINKSQIENMLAELQEAISTLRREATQSVDGIAKEQFEKIKNKITYKVEPTVQH